VAGSTDAGTRELPTINHIPPEPDLPGGDAAGVAAGPRRWRRLLAAWAAPAGVVAVVVALASLAAAGLLDAVPLLDIRSAIAVEAVGGVLLALSWWSRDRRWWQWRLPIVVFAAATLTAATAATLRLTGTVTDPYPPTFGVWVGLALAALIGAPFTLRRPGQIRRAVALAAVPLTVSGAFLLINNEYGLWPHLGDVLGHDDQTNADLYRALHLPPGAARPDKGVVAAVDVPAARSHFTHRPGSIYLPPAYFTKSRPNLPVIVMLAGAPGSPTHWITAGHAVQTMDAYAAAHHGQAPILIFVDQNGSSTGDTECVDGPQGMAETYLTVDIPAFVAKTLHVRHNANHWAIVGFSEGGTCALDLTLGHPTIFRHFADLGGDEKPTLGNPAHTLSALFGGSTSAQADHDAAHLLATHKYRGITAWFAAGADDRKKIPVAQTMAAAARRAGIKTHEFTGTGGHNWQFASAAFQRIAPDLCHDLGMH
jgi:S-formylglutathione hydrolase FrmB